MARVRKFGPGASPFYLIPIMMGMAGVLFAGQLDNSLHRGTVVFLCLAVPLFLGGNILARFSMDFWQRAVLLAGMALLVIGAVYNSQLGYAEIFESSELVSERLSTISRTLGLGSLLLGLMTVLYVLVRSQAVMNELSERFRHVSEHMAEGFILTDDNGKIVLVNSSFVDMAGIPEDRFVGRDALSLAKELGADTIVKHTKHRAFGVASEYQVSWERNGELRQYWINGTPIYDRRGRRVGTLATARDITEQHRMSKQLEDYTARLQQLVEEQTQRLRASEERMRGLLLHMNEGFVTLDSSRQVTFVNEFMCEMLGLSAESLRGSALTDFIAMEDRERFERDLHGVGENGVTSPAQEYTVVRDDRNRVAVKMGIARIHGSPEDGAAWSLVVTDVQALKAMQHQLEVRARQLEEVNEELRRLDRAKDVFLSNVSHELRTPLSTVQGYIEMWESGDLGEVDGPQRGALNVMGRNVDRLTRLINEMIEFSRMEITGVRLYRTLFDPAKLVDECVASARPQATQKNISVNAFVPQDLPDMWGDRGKLCQVLGVLLSNAVKFSREGALVQVSLTSDGKGGIELAVADTGIGIPLADQDRVFEKFYQVDSSYTRQYQGTGIGLSIAKSIVEAHEGAIALTSAPKKGTTFTVALPNVLFQRGSVPAKFAELDAIRVVIGSDQKEFRKTIGEFLTNAGCVVSTFSSGHESARASGEQAPDLFLMDEILSDLHGNEVVALIREDLRTSTTPVLMFTSAREVADPQKQIFDRVWELQKPFTSDELLLKVLKVCALSGEIGEAWAASAEKKQQANSMN